MTSIATGADPHAPDVVTWLSALDINGLTWLPVPGCPGVHAKDLWHSGEAAAALIAYLPGASTPGRPHRDAHQHIWVVKGTISVAGTAHVAGSYLHVPPGATHAIIAVGVQEAVLLQVHHQSIGQS
jgi:quercetin dioxygenase-like cupin family protein